MFQENDRIRLVRDVGKRKAGTEGRFKEYVDDLTAKVDLGETKWVDVDIADIEKVS